MIFFASARKNTTRKNIYTYQRKFIISGAIGAHSH